MIKYLCFRPLSIDNISARNITSSNASDLNASGLKRRWKLIVQHELTELENLQDLINAIKTKDLVNIYAIGVHAKLNTLTEDICQEIINNNNLYYIFDIDEIIHLKGDFALTKLLHKIILNSRVFIPNNKKDDYYEKLLKLKSIIENTENILFESCYEEKIDDFSLGANIYLDFREMQNVKRLDYTKFFISTSYSDELVQNNEQDIIKYAGWDIFRKTGLFDLFYFLRDKGLCEQEIVNCIYNRFINFYNK